MLAGAAFPAAFLTRKLDSFLLWRRADPTVGGFILLLLVTLSVPIIKSIHLLVIDVGTTGVRAATVGVFGACYEGFKTGLVYFPRPYTPLSMLISRIAGIGISSNGRCTSPSVGFNLDTQLLGEFSRTRAGNVIIKSLVGSLVINAIAAGLAGLSAIFALLAYFCSSRAMEIVRFATPISRSVKADIQLTFITLLLSALMAWLVWFLDLALVLVARKRINDYSNGALTGHIGNAVWMGLAAAVGIVPFLTANWLMVIDRFDSGYLCRRMRSFRSIFVEE
jgi:hypothetical protein